MANPAARRMSALTPVLLATITGSALWEPRDSLRFCSPHRVPRDYLTAFDAVVVALRGARVSTRSYARPPAELPQRWAGGHAADDIGNKWVRPVCDRLVPLEPGNPWAHVMYAITHITTLPHVSHNVRMHSHDTIRDIADYMVAAGTSLVANGLARRQLMEAAASALRPFADWVVDHIMTLEARVICSQVNVPLMCAWIEAYDWPDINLGKHLTAGFPSFGTLADSGLFRPVCRPAAYTLDELGEGRARRPQPQGPDGKASPQQYHPSNGCVTLQ